MERVSDCVSEVNSKTVPFPLVRVTLEMVVLLNVREADVVEKRG